MNDLFSSEFGDVYERKVEQAIKLLRGYDGECIEVAFSGGKDSAVILELVKMAGIPYRAIYKNTTIDPPGTIAYCKANGVEIMNPETTFLELVKIAGIPSRFYRFCCKHLKEYKILDDVVLGIRKEESYKRNKIYKEPIVCRAYSSKNKVRQWLPILYWTNDDVLRFIKERKIQLHKLYYNERGEIDVTRRLGCMGCPLQRDNGLQDFKDRPKLLKLLLKSANYRYNNTTGAIKTKKKFKNVYEIISFNLFYHNMIEFNNAKCGMFGELNFKEELEDYFKINLDF